MTKRSNTLFATATAVLAMAISATSASAIVVPPTWGVTCSQQGMSIINGGWYAQGVIGVKCSATGSNAGKTYRVYMNLYSPTNRVHSASWDIRADGVTRSLSGPLAQPYERGLWRMNFWVANYASPTVSRKFG